MPKYGRAWSELNCIKIGRPSAGAIRSEGAGVSVSRTPQDPGLSVSLVRMLDFPLDRVVARSGTA